MTDLFGTHVKDARSGKTGRAISADYRFRMTGVWVLWDHGGPRPKWHRPDRLRASGVLSEAATPQMTPTAVWAHSMPSRPVTTETFGMAVQHAVLTPSAGRLISIQARGGAQGVWVLWRNGGPWRPSWHPIDALRPADVAVSADDTLSGHLARIARGQEPTALPLDCLRTVEDIDRLCGEDEWSQEPTGGGTGTGSWKHVSGVEVRAVATGAALTVKVFSPKRGNTWTWHGVNLSASTLLAAIRSAREETP